jgi:hypothetical protein
MEGKARFIFPVLMAGIMAFLMTGLITWLNLGFPPGFGWLWARAFLIAWPAATVAAFVSIPTARKATAIIVRFIERTWK